MDGRSAEYECMLKESHGGHHELKSNVNGINLRNLDTKLTAKVTRCVLRTALDLAYSNRWIADWLFPSSNTSHPPLTPEAFENGLAIHLSHTLSSPMNYGNVREMIMNKETDLLVVPVCRMGSTTVGYTFCSGRKYEQLTGHQPVTHVAGDFMMSRFIFDTTRRQFLIVSTMPSDGVVGILQTTFHCDGSCERNFITSPFLHYNADFLPTTILTSQCNLETRDLSSSTNPASTDPECSSKKAPSNSSKDLLAGVSVLTPNSLPNLNQSMDDLLNELTSNTPSLSPNGEPKLFSPTDQIFGDADPTTSSGSSGEFPTAPFSPTDNIPVDLGAGDPTFDQFLGDEEIDCFDPTLPQRWNFNADGSTDDGVGIPRKPGPSSTCSGAFNMGDLLDSLSKLEKHVKGQFFCLRAKSDQIDPNTGELLSRRTGQQVSAVTSLDPFTTRRLRTIAAQSYYGTNLSPKIDSPLFATPGGVLPPGIANGRFFSSNSPASFSSNSFNSSSVNSNSLVVPPSIGNRTQALQDLLVPTSSVSGGAPLNLALPSTVPANGRALNILAPRLVPAIDTPTPLEGANGRSKERSDVDKAELKKIRNRLSAAKSNQRRRIQLEAQRKELENLQGKVIELEKLKQKRTEENTRLRQQLFGFLPVSEISF